MTFFLPSSIQKRLLRYALSQLDVLDIDALDLDNLEIGWGRKSTVELKEVALHKSKLAALLHLPATLHVQEAVVRSLRVTVPADLHTSPIIVDITGVSGALSLVKDGTQDAAQKSKSKPRTSSKAARDTRGKSRSNRTRFYVSDGLENEADAALPSADQLAQSFLRTEPRAEREQLEAALLSRSSDLKASIASSGDGGSNSGTGIGIHFALPSFLAGFLQGIADRLQVMVKDVSLDLVFDADSSPEPGLSHTTTPEMNTSTLKVLVATVEVASVITSNNLHVDSSVSSEGLKSQTHRLGERLVTIRDIKGVLVPAGPNPSRLNQTMPSESSDSTSSILKQKLRRSWSPEPEPEPVGLEASRCFVAGKKGTPSTTPSLPGKRQTSTIEHGSESVVDSPISSHYNRPDRKPWSNLHSSVGSYANFAKGSEQEDDVPSPVVENLASSGFPFHFDPDASIRGSEGKSSSSYHGHLQESVMVSQTYMYDSARNTLEEDERFLDSGMSPADQDLFVPSAENMSSTSTPIESPEQPMPGQFRTESPEDRGARAMTISSQARHSLLLGDLETPQPTPSANEELAESRYFSHDEAESIYTSAMYDASEEGATKSSVLVENASLPQDPSPSEQAVPGSWDRSQNLASSELTESGLETQAGSATSKLTTPAEARGKLSSTSRRSSSHGSKHNERSESTETSREKTPDLTSLDRQKLDVIGKQWFSVDQIQIWIAQPSESDVKMLEAPKIKPSKARTQSSAHVEMPGAFSVYASTNAPQPGTDESLHQEMGSDSAFMPVEESASNATESSVEILVGTVELYIDIALAQAAHQLLNILQLSSSDEAVETNSTTPDRRKQKSDADLGLRFSLQIVDMKLLIFDRIPHSAITSRHDPALVRDSDRMLYQDALFIAKLQYINFKTADINRLEECEVSTKKASVGYLDGNIISFNKQSSIRTSIRDLTEDKDQDIGMKFVQDASTMEVHVWTRPLKVVLDLEKLDSTLGSIGGLSGLLDLGTSITSEATVVGRQPTSMLSKSVHFASGEKAPAATSKKPQLTKINARLSGAEFTLKGEKCSIKYLSSAVKVVARADKIGVSVDDMRLSGPHLAGSYGESVAVLRLRGTTLRYLNSPQEHDLTRLISLLTPSKDKFEEDDDLILDTLLRQRRKGAVLRVQITKAEADISDLEALEGLTQLGDEMTKLSSVAKYLPEETRPGVMTLAFVSEAVLEARVNSSIGTISTHLRGVDLAHVGGPALLATAVQYVAVDSDVLGALIGQVLPPNQSEQLPMLMARLIGDDLEPTWKVKFWNMRLEYSVPTLLAFTDFAAGRPQQGQSSTPISHATLKKQATQSSTMSDRSGRNDIAMRFNLTFRDTVLGLSPLKRTSKILVLLTEANIVGTTPGKLGSEAVVTINKGSLLLIDDVDCLTSTGQGQTEKEDGSQRGANHISRLCDLGYVSVCYVSAAVVKILTTRDVVNGDEVLTVDFRDELFVLETCADSTQTLSDAFGALSPPSSPSRGLKYRTEVESIQDMMASFTGDAFALQPRSLDELPWYGSEEDHENALVDEDYSQDFDSLGEFAPEEEVTFYPHEMDEEIEDYQSSRLYASVEGTVEEQIASTMVDNISGGFTPGVLPSRFHGAANKWDSANNKYVPVTKSELLKCSLNVKVRDVHFIWNLYDGYDWNRTRQKITKAVEDVEAKAEEKRNTRRTTHVDEEDDESVIGDFLFNSIYIGVPNMEDPKELSRQINKNIDDLASETTGYTANTSASRPSSAHRRSRSYGARLKLERSKRHKMAFEVRGIAADVFKFPEGGETRMSIDIRIQDFEIFDHVPTSTWKKFATYMDDAGAREDGKPMIHLEICDVRPVPELTATELVIRATVLPMRLHVDQDALDFITRFFDFKDDTNGSISTEPEQPYLQRVEVCAVPIKLDYKPKKIDFAGLRSGRTKEFMNFFILDGADMVLKHTIVYGTSGFAKLQVSLEDVWMPDIKNNQLPGVLSGLNGVRTLVNVGSGVRDLIVIPIREYKKDGRIVRSISKGAVAFAKTTGGELTRFGAKLAVGAQQVLQGAENYFVNSKEDGDGGWETADMREEERRAVSRYANQPAGILSGLKGAARSLERDLLVARDTIIAISGEMRESGNAEGAARAMVRNAPTLILRPMIGASKAISQTLMGATNSMDSQNRRRMEDKYKRY